ncbi:MAG: aryl-sulfate sulfotransferase, partial [Desulfatiglandales bacterium]|nr:aryl-sulfate sulfotransferase [Desulfatiglandales bacterium]
MSVAFTNIKGVVFCDSRRSYNGVTLFTPVDGRGAWLIDMQGRFVNHWDVGYEPGCYGELLPNGNLLYAGKIADGPLVDLEGAGGILLELDWDSKIVWEYQDPYLHHAFCRTKNGNTLVLKWIEVPSEIAVRVEGGDPGTEREGIMWGDVIQEITPSGEVVWEWIAHEHLDPEVEITCPICPRSTWTHINACIELPDGDVLTSFMKNHTVAIINKKTGEIKWRWGPLGHQHSPTMLDNGNILVFDNGSHPHGYAPGVSAVLEINRDSDKVAWYFTGGEGSPMLFYSSTMSSCQRLPNGNTFICEGTTGRLFEISPSGDLVWEYVNNLPSIETSPIKTKPCMVYSAYRYGVDYPGLKRPLPMPIERELVPD